MMDNFSTNRASFCGGVPLATSSRSRTPYILLVLCVVYVATCFGSPSTGIGVVQPIVTATNGTKSVKHPPSITPTLERQTLLASVTVSGISAPQVSPLTALWQSRAVRWGLGVVVIAVLYVAIYLSAQGAIPKGFRVEPSTSPRQLHVARNLLIGVAVFTCLDGVIFHTGLYASILAPASYAGRMAMLTRAEKQRVSSGLKEVLVVGDSRIAEGFSAAAADKLGSEAGFKCWSVAGAASSIDTGYLWSPGV